MAEQIQAIYAEELRTVEKKLSATAERGRDTRIHEARKSMKKMRALLRLVKKSLGTETFRENNAAIREVAQSVSQLRDAHVLLETFDSISQNAALRQDLAADKAALDMRGAMRTGSHKINLVGGALLPLQLRGDGSDAIFGGMVRFYKLGREAWQEARKVPSPQNMHEWRKRVKDHWYHVRLLDAPEGSAFAQREDELGQLETLLGDSHNLAVLRDRLLCLEGAGGEEAIAALDARDAKLQDQAFALGNELYARRAGSLKRDLAQFYEASTLEVRVGYLHDANGTARSRNQTAKGARALALSAQG